MKRIFSGFSIFSRRWYDRLKVLQLGLAGLLFILLLPAGVFGESANEIVSRANDLMHGSSSTATAVMTVVKPDWSREMTTKLWMLEPDYAMILITAPAKDKGNVTLKRENEIWNWVPTIERVIKIPPSMMLQPWMGSNFTNDDLVRESSIVEDYTQEIVGEETIDGFACHKIRLMPKPEAGVVWGKLVMWISKEGYLELRIEYYDEDDGLVKYMTGSEVKEIGGRTLPTRWEMVPVDEEGEKTVLEYREMAFDVGLSPTFFSQQNMKRVR